MWNEEIYEREVYIRSYKNSSFLLINSDHCYESP
jgi:hypothetical protein